MRSFPRIQRTRPRLALRLGAAVVAAAALSFGALSPAGAETSHGATNAANAASHIVNATSVNNAFAGSTIPGRDKPHVISNVAGLPGIDVSSYQGSVNWAAAKADGENFAYIKATQATDYTNPDFTQQYDGSYNEGIIRGSYHFAIPSASSGAAQADYFVAHGGGWSADGKTLPGALDIEYNPSGAECYGLSQSGMVSWVSSFVNEYHAKTGRWAVIYTTTDWWSTCTGNSSAFASNDPLWIANYNGTASPLPAGWGFYTFWQYGDTGTFGDEDTFNGSATNLENLANNT